MSPLATFPITDFQQTPITGFTAHILKLFDSYEKFKPCYQQLRRHATLYF